MSQEDQKEVLIVYEGHRRVLKYNEHEEIRTLMAAALRLFADILPSGDYDKFYFQVESSKWGMVDLLCKKCDGIPGDATLYLRAGRSSTKVGIFTSLFYYYVTDLAVIQVKCFTVGKFYRFYRQKHLQVELKLYVNTSPIHLMQVYSQNFLARSQPDDLIQMLTVLFHLNFLRKKLQIKGEE